MWSSGTLPGLLLKVLCLYARFATADLVTDGGEEVGIVRVETCVQNSFDGRAGAFCLHDGGGVEWVTGRRVR